MNGAKMDCGSVKAKLIDLVYGELSPAEDQALREHCGRCPGCGEELAALTETLELTRRAPEPDLPPFLNARVMAHAREQAAMKKKPARRWAWFMRPQVAMAAVAMIAASIVIVIVAERGIGPRATYQAAVPQQEKAESGLAKDLDIESEYKGGAVANGLAAEPAPAAGSTAAPMAPAAAAVRMEEPRPAEERPRHESVRPREAAQARPVPGGGAAANAPAAPAGPAEAGGQAEPAPAQPSAPSEPHLLEASPPAAPPAPPPSASGHAKGLLMMEEESADEMRAAPAQPPSPGQLVATAGALEKEGKYADALAAYRQALAGLGYAPGNTRQPPCSPLLREALTGAGRCQVKLGKKADADATAAVLRTICPQK